MKKRNVILALALCSALTMQAQTVDNRALGYSVRYEKEHLFLQKDSGLNVVDYDIEWPDVVGFSKVPSLKRYISQSLVGQPVESFDSVQIAVNDTYGMPVTKKFDTIPDDRRFCYVTATARIVAYSPNHWIAYYIDNNVEPQKLSAFKAIHSTRVVVFDIDRQNVMMANDMLRYGVVQRLESQDFYDNLFAPLSDDLFNDMQQCDISGVWAGGSNLYFLVNATTSSRHVSYTATMPLAEYSYVLSRDAKRVFLKASKRKEFETIFAPNTWRGDSIYNNVEKMPEFKGGNSGLSEYLSHVSRPNVVVSKACRVYLSFIVDKDGAVRDVSVVTPVSPDLDRHAASVVKGMPPYTPGEHNGKKVCVRMYLPVSYRP